MDELHRATWPAREIRPGITRGDAYTEIVPRVGDWPTSATYHFITDALGQRIVPEREA